MDSGVKIAEQVKERPFLATVFLAGSTVLLPLVFQILSFVLMFYFVEVESVAEEMWSFCLIWGSILLAVFSAFLGSKIIGKHSKGKALSLNKKRVILVISVVVYIAIALAVLSVLAFGYYDITNN